MMKIQSTAPITQHLSRQYTNSLNTDGASVLSSIKNSDESVNFITFNQDCSCVALGLNNGYKIFNCQPNFGRCYQFKKDESIGIVEMLYCTSLVAIVGLGEEIGSSPRKLRIINTKKQSTICDLIFPSSILRVKLTKTKLIVVLEDQIYIYDISTMKLLHTIETSPNTFGLCAISYDPDKQGNNYLAYPSPPKTITHDSLLANGINTNGGTKSIQNNIHSVSNAPNRIGDVIIFNLSTLEPISVIEAHKSTIAAMEFSQDGTLFATASDKGTIVRVFSVKTGVKLYQFRRGTYPTKIYSLRFSSDNQYVIATSSSLTVHIFRLGEEEALANKQKSKRLNNDKRKYEPIAEEIEEEGQNIKKVSLPSGPSSPTSPKPRSINNNNNNRKSSVLEEDFEEIRDDGDDSDAMDDDDDEGEEQDEEGVDDDVDSLDVISSTKHRKLSQGSTNSYASINSEDVAGGNKDLSSSSSPKTEPLIDQTRLSMARLIRRSSQTLGRKAAQKMGDFLPSRFSSILEPTRHFASLKINAISKDAKSIAVMTNVLQHDFIPQSYNIKDNDSINSGNNRELVEVNLLHIYVVTSEGVFYIYGLDPERGGDCILLNQYSLLDES